MTRILDLIADEMKSAFTACGYDASYAKVVLSNRPDLCEYQCNGAMAAAKAYKKKPIDIANEVVEKLNGDTMFSEINAVMPGFINIRLNTAYLADFMNGMAREEKLGVEEEGHGETIIVDYGGANVAKPLHVGHPRSYTALDIVARKRRMQGYNVLYPMGWDAFGLPTGNFAIKNHIHPEIVTAQNVAHFKAQLKSLGLEGKLLIVVAEEELNENLILASRNLKEVLVVPPRYADPLCFITRMTLMAPISWPVEVWMMVRLSRLFSGE